MPGVDILSGLLRGFESIAGPRLEQQSHERAARSAAEEVQIHKEVRKKLAELSGSEEGQKLLAEHPEYLQLGLSAMPGVDEKSGGMLSKLLGGKAGGKFDPDIAVKLLTTPDPRAAKFDAMMMPGGTSAPAPNPTGTGSAVPATASPSPSTAGPAAGIPADTSLSLKLPGGRSITRKGATRLEGQDAQVLAAKNAVLNDGKSLDEATTGMVPEVKKRLGESFAHDLDAELAARGLSDVERAQAISRAGLGSYLPPGQAGLATGRARAVESARGRLDVEKEKFGFTAAPDGGVSASPINSGPLPGEPFGRYQTRVKEADKRAAADLKPLPGKDAALMVLPDGRSAGEAGVRTQGQAEQKGAISITRDQAVIRSNLRTSLPMLETMSDAIPKLYPDDTIAGQAQRTVQYEFQKKRGTNKTLQDLQRVNDSAMHLVRNILNEKGNLRGDVLANARANLFHSHETKTSAESKLEFWRSIFASAYSASGAPPPPEAAGVLKGAKIESLYTGGESAFPGIAAEPTASEHDPYETSLSSQEEQQFQLWKQKYAPKDSGKDYDLRGAFKAGLTPAANGHWPDTYKKPNHPTFSNQSIYAKDAPEKAGHWNGETYVPAGAPKTAEEFLQRNP